ncbi:MAG TPA: hypothetical protein VGQ24_09365 [Gemmatimonadales bacterium]|jgi:hypothetical protein|nr:hypothetical protein [Gemmatimonadales bacterium]
MATGSALLTIRDAHEGEALAALLLHPLLGFREIAPYPTNPVKGAVFLELQLDPSPHDP